MIPFSRLQLLVGSEQRGASCTPLLKNAPGPAAVLDPKLQKPGFSKDLRPLLGVIPQIRGVLAL